MFFFLIVTNILASCALPLPLANAQCAVCSCINTSDKVFYEVNSNDMAIKITVCVRSLVSQVIICQMHPRTRWLRSLKRRRRRRCCCQTRRCLSFDHRPLMVWFCVGIKCKLSAFSIASLPCDDYRRFDVCVRAFERFAAGKDQNGYICGVTANGALCHQPQKTVKHIRRNCICTKDEFVRRTLNGWMLPISPNAKYVLKLPFCCVHAKRWHLAMHCVQGIGDVTSWNRWNPVKPSNYTHIYDFMFGFPCMNSAPFVGEYRIVSCLFSKWRDTYYITITCSACSWYARMNLCYSEITTYSNSSRSSAICARFHQPRGRYRYTTFAVAANKKMWIIKFYLFCFFRFVSFLFFFVIFGLRFSYCACIHNNIRVIFYMRCIYAFHIYHKMTTMFEILMDHYSFMGNHTYAEQIRVIFIAMHFERRMPNAM